MLDNKIVLVTGGAGRIGSIFCKGILENNGRVVISDISKERGRLLEEEFSNPNAIFIESDTTKVESIKDLISSSVKHFGVGLDAAVHCAYPMSGGWGARIEDVKAEDLSKDLFSQLGGAILFSQQISSHFKNNGGGNLIHISSIQGVTSPKFEHYEGTSMMSPIEYTAIKSAIISITKYLAKYYKNNNMRINSISPGGILDSQPVGFIKNYAESCNSKGMLDSRDLLGALIFLLSDESKFITGQNLIVDDGWSL